MSERYFNKLVQVKDLRRRDVVNGGAFQGMPGWPMVVKDVQRQICGAQLRRHQITFADGTQYSVASDTLVQIHRNG